MNDMAPTLPTSCGSLPPEGAAAPAVWQSQSRGPGLKYGPHGRALRVAPCPPRGGGAAPAVWQSQSRGPGLDGEASTLIVRLSLHPDNRISGSLFGHP
jgi:[glutamine synthetase] adenylyltransferase / [glutamine synthetase]-adenylyl-L-tyrosine phosphorylase